MDYFIVGEESESVGDVCQQVEFGLNGERVLAEREVIEQRDVVGIVVHEKAVAKGEVFLAAAVVLQQVSAVG